MNLAEAVGLEHVGENRGVKVAQMRGRKAALPHAVEGTMETEPTENAREPEENAPAARKGQNQKAARDKPLEASVGGLTRRWQVLEDVVKRDDFIKLPGREILREEAGYDAQSRRASLVRDRRIRFEAGGGIPSTGGGLEEPTVGAADVQ